MFWDEMLSGVLPESRFLTSFGMTISFCVIIF